MNSLAFLVGKDVLAVRTWSSVPSIGHTVEIDGKDHKTVMLLVKDVVWRRGIDTGQAMIDVICTRRK